MTPAQAAEALKIEIHAERERVEQQVVNRYPRASNALRNAALSVLANPSPSAPGNPPGVRTGNLRRNWSMYYSGGGNGGTFGIQSGMGYSGYLEHGTRKMAARPYVEKVKQEAMPNIVAIFAEIGG